MKTPIYEPTPGALLAMMFPTDGTTPQFVFCDLYTIILPSGPTLTFTTADQDVGYSQGGPDTVWSSKTVRFDYQKSRATAHWKVGVDVDTWQVAVFPRAFDDLDTDETYPDTIAGQPFLKACVGGMLDGATVYVDRAYFPSWPTPSATHIEPTGVLPIFAGRIAEVDVGRSGAVLNINSHMELLTQQMPRNIYQAPCHHTLFDAGCQLNADTFRVTGTVGANSTNVVLLSTVSAPAGSSGTFNLGRVQMTSGQNAGFGRAVRTWTPGVFTLIAPFAFPVAVGDTFYAWPGCNKTMSQCQQFNNLVNYGGEPFIPAPEVAT